MDGRRGHDDTDEIVKDIYMSAVYGIKPEGEEEASDDTMIWGGIGESPSLPKDDFSDLSVFAEKAFAKDAEMQSAGSGHDMSREKDGLPEAAPQESGRNIRPEAREKSTRGRRELIKKGREKKKGKPQRRAKLIRLLSALLAIAGLYCIAVFSDIPFIKKWRDIYIETAMGTMTHQWLATAFIPDFVIEEVMTVREDYEEFQQGIDTNWSIDELKNAGKKIKWKDLEKSFFKLYPEIDKDSFESYMEGHEDESITESGYLVIDKASRGDEDTGIRTASGDRVLAIDTLNGITIAMVEGSDYAGYLAIIKDPSQVGVSPASTLGTQGQHIAGIAEESNAVLAVNASGFYDPGGHGNGGTVHGLLISDGEKLSDWSWGTNKVIGFDEDDTLYVGTYKEENDLRDAVEFKPMLVYDGIKAVEGSAGWGISPRSAIGQTKDGQVLLLVVDGRQPGYSIGCTMGDLADIMLRYDAYQACNLDGGSSSIMYYNGRKITKPSSGDKTNGRYLPDAFTVAAR